MSFVLRILLSITVLLYCTNNALAEDVAEESVFDVTESLDTEASDDVSAFSKLGTDKVVNTATAEQPGYYDAARLIVLNKITANAKKITIPIGQVAYFNNAEIKLEKCWKSPDKNAPSSQMLITITENKFDDDAKLIFHGWLISSQAALSTFEHPVYEVLAVECVGNKVY